MATYDFDGYTYQPLDFNLGGGGGGFTGRGSIGFQAPVQADIGAGYNEYTRAYTPIDFSNLYTGGGGGFQLPRTLGTNLGGLEQLGISSRPVAAGIPLQEPTVQAAMPATAANRQLLNYGDLGYEGRGGFQLPEAGAGARAADMSGRTTTGQEEPGVGQTIVNRLNEVEQNLRKNPGLAKILGASLPALTGVILSRQAQRQAEDVERITIVTGKQIGRAHV